MKSFKAFLKFIFLSTLISKTFGFQVKKFPITTNKKGTATTEFILVFPIFIFTFLMLFDVGFLYITKAALRFAALEAGRFCQLGHTLPSLNRQDSIKKIAQDRFFWSLSSMSLELKSYQTFPHLASDTNSSSGPGNPNDIVKLRLSIPYRLFTPGFNFFFLGSTNQITSEVIIRNERTF